MDINEIVKELKRHDYSHFNEFYDLTNKAIYFWNPDIATCKWIKTLNPYLRIGNHVFAK